MNNGNILACHMASMHSTVTAAEPTDVELVMACILRACVNRSRKITVNITTLHNPGTIKERLASLGYKSEKKGTDLTVRW